MPNNATTTLPVIDESIMDELRAILSLDKPSLTYVRDCLSAGIAKNYAQLEYKSDLDPLSLVWSIAMNERVKMVLEFSGEVHVSNDEDGDVRTFRNIKLRSATMISRVRPNHFMVIDLPQAKSGAFDWVIYGGFLSHNADQRKLEVRTHPKLYILSKHV